MAFYAARNGQRGDGRGENPALPWPIPYALA
jgi:hypothetical protein